MRRLLVLILLFAAGYSGYWVIGARGVDRAARAWFAERRAEGWQADYAALDVQGFPNRFDIALTRPALADPDTGLAWTAPRFQIDSLSYDRRKFIAVWPQTQQIATPQGKAGIESRDMRASLVLDRKTELALQRGVLTARQLRITPRRAGAAPLTLDKLSLAAEALPPEGAARDDAPGLPYRLGLRAGGLQPPEGWRATVDPSGALPDRFSALSADMTVHFDRPWDIRALNDARPQPTHIRLRRVEASWGPMQLIAAGEIGLGQTGRPVSGAITVKARHWRQILDLATRAGVLPGALRGTVEGALSLVAKSSGTPDSLDIPLSFQGGRVWLGIVPLGQAPVLSLR